MKQEAFVIRAYGKSELAMMYFPGDSKKGALRKLRQWLSINPRLRMMIGKGKNYTPKQVRAIVEEVGEP